MPELLCQTGEHTTMKTYQLVDNILPDLELPDPCPIRITITETDVCLYIGPRDFQWNKETEEWIGSGTDLS